MFGNIRLTFGHFENLWKSLENGQKSSEIIKNLLIIILKNTTSVTDEVWMISDEIVHAFKFYLRSEFENILNPFNYVSGAGNQYFQLCSY